SSGEDERLIVLLLLLMLFDGANKGIYSLFEIQLFVHSFLFFFAFTFYGTAFKVQTEAIQSNTLMDSFFWLPFLCFFLFLFLFLFAAFAMRGSLLVSVVFVLLGYWISINQSTILHYVALFRGDGTIEKEKPNFDDILQMF